jgi:hypothetical protein
VFDGSQAIGHFSTLFANTLLTARRASSTAT